MGNLFKVKNIKISIFSFLILNQFLLSADALNSRKIYEVNANVKNFQKKTNNENRISSTQKTKNENQNFLNEAIELEKFVDETFGLPTLRILIIQKKKFLAKFRCRIFRERLD